VTPDVSICIATYRRPRGLARLLASLSRLKLPEAVTIEVLVVDNDAAGSARAGASAECPFVDQVRWLSEPERNIAIARNRALDAARGRWVAFLDDDEYVDEDWLAGYWEQVERGESDGFFGPVEPSLEAGAAAWIDGETFYGRPHYATGTPLATEALCTSNALIRRALFDDRRFDPAWGRSGGSDSELFGRMLAGGARFVWCDEANAQETIPLQRQSLRWLAQRAFRGGVGHTRLQRRRGRAGRFAIGLRAALALVFLTPLVPLALAGGRARAARVWLRICTQAGHLWALAGRSYEEYGGLDACASLE
jgi:succinoglycan biosynthesis protein ExoM